MIWTTAVLPILLAAIFYSHLPGTIPIHWGIDGQVNGWAARPMIFLLSAIGLLLTLAMLLAAKLTPKQTNVQRNQALYQGFILMLNLLILSITAMTITEALRPGTLDIGRIVVILIGIVWAFLGNLLPKVKQNYIFGVRTSWALDNEQNWQYTNRISGWMLFLSGICMILSTFWLSGMYLFVLIIALAAATVALSYLASYLYYRQNNP